MIRTSIQIPGSNAASNLSQLTSNSLAKFHRLPSLQRPRPQLIRAGLRGGLPHDGLSTDLVNGCLPAPKICYGECFAARYAFERANIDFGTRVRNKFDPEIFAEDLAHISPQQCFVRQGWNSDPSWDWDGITALQLVRLIHESGRRPVLLTKAFRKLTKNRILELIEGNVELRVCVSAFDSDAQLARRIQLSKTFRDFGGLAIPVVMTAAFKDPRLTARQDAIVDHLIDLDLPAAENSIRFHPSSPVINVINLNTCGRTRGSGDWWAGRLYPNQLRVPTLSSVPPNYKGVDIRHSRNDPEWLQSLFADPVPTNEHILSGGRLEKPACAGIPKDWNMTRIAENGC